MSLTSVNWSAAKCWISNSYFTLGVWRGGLGSLESAQWTSMNFLLGATAEALRANIDWKSAISLQRGQLDLKFQVEGVAPTNHSSSQKTKINNLSCNIKIWTDLSSVLSQCTPLTDGQTDRQTDNFLVDKPRWHLMQRGKTLSQLCVSVWFSCLINNFSHHPAAYIP